MAGCPVTKQDSRAEVVSISGLVAVAHSLGQMYVITSGLSLSCPFNPHV